MDFFCGKKLWKMGRPHDIKTNVRTCENAHGAANFIEIKINVSILLRVLTNKIFHIVHWPKPIDLSFIPTVVVAPLPPLLLKMS